jgi:hypothetical protein
MSHGIGRRQRDIGLAAGYTMSVQEATGLDIAFAAIVHLGQAVPARYLCCILKSRDMATLKTADGAFDLHNGSDTAEHPGSRDRSPNGCIRGASC